MFPHPCCRNVHSACQTISKKGFIGALQTTSHLCTNSQGIVIYAQEMSAHVKFWAARTRYQPFCLIQVLSSTSRKAYLLQSPSWLQLYQILDFKLPLQIFPPATEVHSEKHAAYFSNQSNMLRSGSCKYAVAIAKIAAQASSTNSSGL